MAVVRSIGPKVTQLVLYQDVSLGAIAAIITAVSKTDGTISVTAFPAGSSPVTHTGVSYDYTGAVAGAWHYHETDVI